jgi:hypothetical protein
MCGLPGHTYDELGFVLCKTGCDIFSMSAFLAKMLILIIKPTISKELVSA